MHVSLQIIKKAGKETISLLVVASVSVFLKAVRPDERAEGGDAADTERTEGRECRY